MLSGNIQRHHNKTLNAQMHTLSEAFTDTNHKFTTWLKHGSVAYVYMSKEMISIPCLEIKKKLPLIFASNFATC